MPSVSRQQQKLMHGIASGNIKPKKGQPSKKVAMEFAKADHNVGRAIVQRKSVKEMRRA